MLIINTRGAVDRVSVDHSFGYSILDKTVIKAAVEWHLYLLGQREKGLLSKR